jgi:hypothetical protein
MMRLSIDDQLQLLSSDFIGKSCAVLGSTGTGKTNTVAVLVEELLASGIPMTIVDPEGEYWGLREKYEVLVVGKSDNVDLEIGVEQAAAIAEYSIMHNVSVILDLLEMSDEQKHEFLFAYFERLWALCLKARKPYQIILEEAHEFIPQGTRTDLKQILTRIALRGRKRGLGIILSSQRSAKVEKDVLTQAQILFLHRVYYTTDVKVYQDVLPMKPAAVEELIQSLKVGEAAVVYQYQVKTAMIRMRDTYHVGTTPDLAVDEKPELRKIDQAMLDELKKLIVREPEEDSQLKSLLEENSTLKQQIAEMQQRHSDEVEHLQLEIAKLSQMKLNVEQPVLPLIFSSVSEVAEPKNEGHPYKSPLATARGINVQERAFKALLDDVQQLPKFQRELLKYMLVREQLAFSIRELARYNGVSESTIYNKPPLDLVKRGLIKREGRGKSCKYQSVARTMLQRSYPDLNGDDLMNRLIAVV